MPIYSYKCYGCEVDFEVLCKYDDRVQVCPECGQADTTVRQVSAPKGYVKKGVYDEFL
jgi:putative FmdB family regulatory protein